MQKHIEKINHDSLLLLFLKTYIYILSQMISETGKITMFWCPRDSWTQGGIPDLDRD